MDFYLNDLRSAAACQAADGFSQIGHTEFRGFTRRTTEHNFTITIQTTKNYIME